MEWPGQTDAFSFKAVVISWLHRWGFFYLCGRQTKRFWAFVLHVGRFVKASGLHACLVFVSIQWGHNIRKISFVHVAQELGFQKKTFLVTPPSVQSFSCQMNISSGLYHKHSILCTIKLPTGWILILLIPRPFTQHFLSVVIYPVQLGCESTK